MDQESRSDRVRLACFDPHERLKANSHDDDEFSGWIVSAVVDEGSPPAFTCQRQTTRCPKLHFLPHMTSRTNALHDTSPRDHFGHPPVTQVCEFDRIISTHWSRACNKTCRCAHRVKQQDRIPTGSRTSCTSYAVGDRHIHGPARGA